MRRAARPDRHKVTVRGFVLQDEGVAASQPAISLADHEATIPGLDHHEGAVDDQTARDDAEQPRTKRLLRERGQCPAQSAHFVRTRVNGRHQQENCRRWRGRSRAR